METFSFYPPLSLVEQEKWVLAVTSFEATTSVVNITHEDNCFSITTSGYWSSRGVATTIAQVQKY